MSTGCCSPGAAADASHELSVCVDGFCRRSPGSHMETHSAAETYQDSDVFGLTGFKVRR